MSKPKPPLEPWRIRLAWAVALTVDAIQIPAELTGPGGWLVGAGLDCLAMGVLWALVGFHWAFLPSFLTEWIPYLNMAPLWTAAVALATRGRSASAPADGKTIETTDEHR